MLMATPFFAQGTIEFCGVPVDGHVDNFVAKMEQLGYSTMVGGEDHTLMIGETAGKYTELVVYYTPKTKTVWAVCPAIEGDGSWSGLKKMYNEYKAMCISQYQGYKVYTWDTFEAPYKEGDGNEMKAIEEEKCNYRTELHGSNGRITVCITRDAFLTIGYMNLKNSDLYEAESDD